MELKIVCSRKAAKRFHSIHTPLIFLYNVNQYTSIRWSLLYSSFPSVRWFSRKSNHVRVTQKNQRRRNNLMFIINGHQIHTYHLKSYLFYSCRSTESETDYTLHSITHTAPRVDLLYAEIYFSYLWMILNDFKQLAVAKLLLFESKKDYYSYSTMRDALKIECFALYWNTEVL